MEHEIGADESISMAVVRAVSAIEGKEPCSIGPLAEVIDPDALDALFARRPNGKPRIGGRISFVYSQSHVTVEAGEYLSVELVGPDPSLREDSAL